METTETTPIPFLIQLEETIETSQIMEHLENLGLKVNPAFLPDNSNNPQILIQSKPFHIVQEENETVQQKEEESSCIFQVVYPHELNLNKACHLKRGRPKKKKPEEKPIEPKAEEPIKGSRTRSGRLVKLPKHIEKDFKRIEITTDEDVQLSDFKRVEEKENSQIKLFPQLNKKKRTISAQYKCPKCFKAYLGKNKMIQHLTKNPDHGPLPSYEEFNFEVWNYLFDITQKCKTGQKGTKFCQELSNLLHNVQLLKNALFKTDSNTGNCVNIDNVLGNAIGLAPGKYTFDESELYKDVTVLKLITNSDFFKTNKENSDSEIEAKKVKYTEIEEDHTKSEKRDESLEQTELLPNLLINSHNSDDELLNCVDSGTNLLDSSISSSEDVINVDQFVNERFKKIIETDLDIGHGTLNLVDLPNLDLFNFHNS